jgi:hypothetical protein
VHATCHQDCDAGTGGVCSNSTRQMPLIPDVDVLIPDDVAQHFASALRVDTAQDRAIVLPLVSRLSTSERQATWHALCPDISRQA